ncbi:AraC family transcriptional regulator [Arenibacter sp. GZD96]|uniref:helix-turn-helix transcriptional regulator n=1 Tax=Aurantibrevibacter litoralis TaxID=3106030 RepID=UPI002AFE10DB|nr:AraC family transcriptional regulator [Arenibacter sp. GZD-96]MEA1784501.1 AraC family transcriptional regulator [Arenibacter sp. GZD-96]
MKIQLETIRPASEGVFRVLHNPRLNHLFYWHFHPELELVYIEGASATRHVGDHISTYVDSDLVLIGPNIPHLNFDYGVQTNYRKEVLHIKPVFLDKIIPEIPELAKIQDLFKKATHGLAFSGTTKKRVGHLMKGLHVLSGSALFVEVLQMLQLLAGSSEFHVLHHSPFVNPYNQREQERLRNIHAFIAAQYQRKIDVDEMASLCYLSKEAFCRYFKRTTGNTFITFLNQYRISQAKRLLMTGKNVSESCFECGFESLSYFNRTFKRITGENPSEFRQKHWRP